MSSSLSSTGKMAGSVFGRMLCLHCSVIDLCLSIESLLSDAVLKSVRLRHWQERDCVLSTATPHQQQELVRLLLRIYRCHNTVTLAVSMPLCQYLCFSSCTILVVSCLFVCLCACVYMSLSLVKQGWADVN